METILTIDIGSTSMRASQHDESGTVLHSCRRDTVPIYKRDKSVELDARRLVANLVSMLTESHDFCRTNKHHIGCISVTSQRSSVVPVDSRGTPLAPFIMWHDKRTLPICQELLPHEDRVYTLTGLRISPVLSAVKMTWLKRNCPEILKQTAKLLGIQDLAIHTLCGEFVTDHSLASNTNLLNIRSRTWDQDLLELFEVDRNHLCDLVEPGTVCGHTDARCMELTRIPDGTPVVSAGGDQQCAALGLGITSEGKVKCTTGTGSYLIAHVDSPVIDEQKRFLCKIGSIPGTYNLEAGLLTTGTVYRWFLEQFYSSPQGAADIEEINREVLSSPPGANGVLLLPHFEGSGAPHWNPRDTGVFYNMSLSTTRADMARAVLESIVMEMGENVSLFKEKLGQVAKVSVSGGMTNFAPYNQLQADVFGSEVALYPTMESTSLGAWIAAAVSCGLYNTHNEAFRVVHPLRSEKISKPDMKQHRFYGELSLKRRKLYRALQTVEL
jgi:sugar (pentulose or hexulose) kinase